MQRFAPLIIIFGFSVLLESAMAQEDGESVPEETAQDERDPQSAEGEVDLAEVVEIAEEAEEEEIVVDDEFYQDVDDKDFRPSEDIPADQSIPFPTDI